MRTYVFLRNNLITINNCCRGQTKVFNQRKVEGEEKQRVALSPYFSNFIGAVKKSKEIVHETEI